MPRTSTFSTLMVFAVLTVAGFALVPQLSLRLLPSAQAPSLTVRYAWPGTSPEVLEREVTAPLEAAFGLVEGVENIRSESGHGSGHILLELGEGRRRDYLRFEVANKVRQLWPHLPQGLRYPQVFLNDTEQQPDDRPLLIYSLSGGGSPAELYRYASETLAPQLALTPGLRRSEVTGGNPMEWLVSYDAEQLRILGLGPGHLRQALDEAFATGALGTVREGNGQYFVRLQQGTVRQDFLEKIPIRKTGRRILHLADVASVNWQEQQPRQHYRINGQTSVRLLLFPEPDVNSIRLADDLKKQMAQLATAFPPGHQLHLDDDATEHLAQELTKIRQRTAWSLGILLLFVLLAYRSWRYLAVVLASLTANLGLAAIGYWLLGVELHLYALAGITVSFGLIIDNSIVMMHHLRQQTNHSVMPALLASTLTTLAGLVAIWYLPAQWQANLGEFARVLAINLAVSLAGAAWLIPALMVRFGISRQGILPKKEKPDGQPNGLLRAHGRLLAFFLRWRKTCILLLVLLFGLPVFLLPGRVEGWDFYNQTLGSDWYSERARPVVNRWLGGTLRLFAWYVWEGGSFRQPEETVLHVQAAMPPGATLPQMDEVLRHIDRYLGQYPQQVKKYVTTVRSGEFGSIQVFFQPGHDGAFPHQLKSRLIAQGINLGGVSWNIFGVGQGFSSGGSGGQPTFQVKMTGYNQDELRRQAERFAEKLTAHPRVQTVDTEANVNWWERDRYAYELQLDHRRLAERNLPPYLLRTLLQDFDQNPSPGLYLPGAQPVRLASSRAAVNDLWKLRNMPQQVDSLTVDFSEVAQLEKRKTAPAIHKENQQYIRLVAFEYTGSRRFGSQYLQEKMDEMRLEMPPGFQLENAQRGWQDEGRRQYGLLALVAGLIFFTCALTFESLRQAAAIVAMVPLSFIGIFLTFYWFGLPFDQGGYTSFLLVSGLTVNSLILIVNDFNALRRGGQAGSSLAIYQLAFRQKMPPVLLSVLSTALGLVPFLLHGAQEAFWFALAAGSIGGLVFSLVAITFFIPLFFVKK